MTTITLKNKLAALLCGFTLLALPLFTQANEMKNADGGAGGDTRIEIKDFHFNPQTLTVKSGSYARLMSVRSGGP